MSQEKRILVVDDEPNIRRILQVALEKEGYTVATAENVNQANKVLEEFSPGCVLTDVTMPGKSGYEFLRDLSKSHDGVPVIVMTAYGTIPQAIQAIRDGAFEYVTKPFDLDSLRKMIAAAFDIGTRAPAKGGKSKEKNTFIAESPAMKQVLETVRQVADSRATVLITGESGSGKEVIAKSLHTLSARAKQPFIAVSCAALPETLLESELFGYEKGAFTGANGSKAGRFELAHTGTLFLDEIGDIPSPTQIKLLRVLQEREFERLGASKPTKVDVRLVTATNKDLQQAVDEGYFRLDLLYRLQVVEIQIPSLRNRIEDIQPLATHFLAKFGAENSRKPLKLGDTTLNALHAYSWPGNVRELENAMERATVLAGASQLEVTPALLPPNITKAAA